MNTNIPFHDHPENFVKMEKKIFAQLAGFYLVGDLPEDVQGIFSKWQVSIEKTLRPTSVKENFNNGGLTTASINLICRNLDTDVSSDLKKLAFIPQLPTEYINCHEQWSMLLEKIATISIPKIANLLIDSKILTKEELQERINQAVSYNHPSQEGESNDEIARSYKKLEKLFQIFNRITPEPEYIKNLLVSINDGLPLEIIRYLEANYQLLKK